MKAQTLLTLRNALQFQLSYREGEESKAFLRDIPHFKFQYALRKNLSRLEKEADLVIESVKNLNSEARRKKAIDEAPDIEIEFHKIKLSEIPEDAKIDASGMWILEHFIDEK